MFTGYSDKLADFFWELRFNNSREWFALHKQEFSSLAAEPTRALANELYDWFAAGSPQLGLNLHISRIYRDARRLFGRGPLKDHIWFSFQNETENRDEAPCFWFEIGAEGYSYGMGCYGAGAAMMRRLRQSIDRDPTELLALQRRLSRQSVFRLEGAEYARPKGHTEDELAHWYNKRNLSLTAARPYDDVSAGRALVTLLEEGFSFLLPYYMLMQRIYKMAD